LLIWIRCYRAAAWPDFYRGESFRLYHPRGSLACLPGFEDSPLDQPMYSHSARTEHLRSLQLIQLSTLCALTLTVDLDPVSAAKGTNTRFVPRVVSARTLARSIQDARDSMVRHLLGEFSDNVGCRCIEDPAMFSAAWLAHVDLRVISSLPMNL
jgi:hypothetical protein